MRMVSVSMKMVNSSSGDPRIFSLPNALKFSVVGGSALLLT